MVTPPQNRGPAGRGAPWPQNRGPAGRRGRVPAKLRAPWRDFVAVVEVRLAAGARAYGDASLRARPASLAGAVEQELLDVLGWGFLLWLRVLGTRFSGARRPARRRGIVRRKPR